MSLSWLAVIDLNVVIVTDCIRGALVRARLGSRCMRFSNRADARPAWADGCRA